MSAGELTIVHVYPSLLGLYGDRGNTLVIAHRARAKGIGVDIVDVAPGQPVPQSADVYLIGGAEDAAQTAAVALLRDDGGLQRAADRGAVVFAVCAGFQILGDSFTASDRQVGGLALLDVATDRLETRAVGEVSAAAVDLALPVLSGFENHGGRTVLGPDATPLARVTHGVGNGSAGTEGAVTGHIVGTYLHGPVLARNPALADLLIGWALGRPFDGGGDPVVAGLRDERLAAARKRST
ncbi:MAG: type 1 glutamine amidotransferase [Acidimicrobiia bacterium]